MIMAQQHRKNDKQRRNDEDERILSTYLEEIYYKEKESKSRNEFLLTQLSKISRNADYLDEKTSKLKSIRKNYEDYLQRLYPTWKNTKDRRDTYNTQHAFMDNKNQKSHESERSKYRHVADVRPDHSMNEYNQKPHFGHDHSMNEYNQKPHVRPDHRQKQNISRSNTLPHEYSNARDVLEPGEILDQSRLFEEFLRKKNEAWEQDEIIRRAQAHDIHAKKREVTDDLISKLEESLSKSEKHVKNMHLSSSFEEDRFQKFLRTPNRHFNKTKEYQKHPTRYLSIENMPPRFKRNEPFLPVYSEFVNHKPSPVYSEFTSHKPSSRDLSPSIFKQTTPPSQQPFQVIPQLLAIDDDGRLFLVPMAASPNLNSSMEQKEKSDYQFSSSSPTRNVKQQQAKVPQQHPKFTLSSKLQNFNEENNRNSSYDFENTFGGSPLPPPDVRDVGSNHADEITKTNVAVNSNVDKSEESEKYRHKTRDINAKHHTTQAGPVITSASLRLYKQDEKPELVNDNAIVSKNVSDRNRKNNEMSPSIKHETNNEGDSTLNVDDLNVDEAPQTEENVILEHPDCENHDSEHIDNLQNFNNNSAKTKKLSRTEKQFKDSFTNSITNNTISEIVEETPQRKTDHNNKLETSFESSNNVDLIHSSQFEKDVSNKPNNGDLHNANETEPRSNKSINVYGTSDVLNDSSMTRSLTREETGNEKVDDTAAMYYMLEKINSVIEDGHFDEFSLNPHVEQDVIEDIIRACREDNSLDDFNTSELHMAFKKLLTNHISFMDAPFLVTDIDSETDFEGDLRDAVNPCYLDLWDMLYSFLTNVIGAFQLDASQVASIYAFILVPNNLVSGGKLLRILTNIFANTANEYTQSDILLKGETTDRNNNSKQIEKEEVSELEDDNVVETDDLVSQESRDHGNIDVRKHDNELKEFESSEILSESISGGSSLLQSLNDSRPENNLLVNSKNKRHIHTNAFFDNYDKDEIEKNVSTVNNNTADNLSENDNEKQSEHDDTLSVNTEELSVKNDKRSVDNIATNDESLNKPAADSFYGSQNFTTSITESFSYKDSFHSRAFPDGSLVRNNSKDDNLSQSIDLDSFNDNEEDESSSTVSFDSEGMPVKRVKQSVKSKEKSTVDENPVDEKSRDLDTGSSAYQKFYRESLTSPVKDDGDDDLENILSESLHKSRSFSQSEGNSSPRRSASPVKLPPSTINMQSSAGSISQSEKKPLNLKKPGFWNHSDSDSDIDLNDLKTSQNTKADEIEDDEFDFDFYD